MIVGGEVALNFPEQRVPEPSRNQGEGEPQAIGVELPPATRADLLDPALWEDGLAKYARATNLAVALADTAGRLIGSTINPRPTWSLLHSKTPSISSPSAEGVGCPFSFSLARLQPCNCIADALARGGVVVAHDRTGLVHFAVPLILGGQPLGALVAGQVFTGYPEQLPLERSATQLLLSPGKVWELARLEHPVKQATLEVYADLLATLGQTFLQSHYHSLREGELLAEMTRLRDRAVAENVERRRAEEALRKSEHGLQFVMDSMPQKIVMAKPNGDIDYFNPQWTEYTGLPFEQIKDWDWKAFVHPDDLGETVRLWKHSIATGELYLQEHRFRRADGEYCWHLSRTLALRDAEGKVVMWVGANTDIHEQRQTANQLRQNAADRSEADHRKDEFLAMLSHELRSPLAPILNAVQLLKLQKGENAVQEKALAIIERQVTQLTRLVDDLMEVSRITTGRVQLRHDRTDVNAIVKRAVETARPLIDQRGHEFTMSLPPDPIWLDADAARLEQVVINLLTNAAKYTNDGGHIWLTVQQEDDECVLRVRDTGVGIAPELLPRIFDLFTQAERSLDRSQGGLGIGLALVQRLVEMHQGSVEATSTLGQGSEFVVRLPVALTHAPPLTSPTTEATKPTGPSLRVLVVDDNVDTAETLSMLLKESGYDVRKAHDGPTAVQGAIDYRPDVVLLDIGLPGLNGYEVAKRIRQHPVLKNVVLVAMTGYGQESDRQRSQEAGFDHHIVKPARFEQLQQILATVSEKVT